MSTPEEGQAAVPEAPEASAPAPEASAPAPVVAVPAEDEKKAPPPAITPEMRSASALGLRRGASVKIMEDGTAEEVVIVGPYAKFITKYPGIVMSSIMIFCVAFFAVVGIPSYFAMFEGGDARRSMEAQKWDACQVATEQAVAFWDDMDDAPVATSSTGPVEPFTQVVPSQRITFWFESKSGDIFTVANMASIAKVLDDSHMLIKNDGVCLKCPSGAPAAACSEDTVVTGCIPADSLIHLVRMELGSTDDVSLDSNTVAVLLSSYGSTPLGQQFIKRYVSQDLNLETGKATWTKGFVQVGGPIGGLEGHPTFHNVSHEEEEQQEIYESFYKHETALGTPTRDGWITKINDIIKAVEDENEDLKVYFGGQIQSMLPRMFSGLIQDVIQAILALLFVGIFMWIQLGSVFLTLVGMFEILMSFILTLSTWKIFGNPSFTFMHGLVIYIILGIGADDIFVFADAWKQSRAQPKGVSGDVATRFQWSFARASSAMLVTSVTTCAAFLLTGMTDLPIISTFGTFSSIVIIWDFVLVITLFPSAVVFHDRYFVNKSNGFCASRACGCLFPVCKGQWGLDGEESDEKKGGEGKQKLRSIELFFHDTLHSALDKFHIRMFVFGLFGVLAIAGIALAASDVKLTTRSITETFLVEANLLQQTLNLMLGNSQAFASGSDSMRRVGYLFFGIDTGSPIDRAGTNPLEEIINMTQSLGKVNYVGEDLTSTSAQLAVIDACEKLDALPSVRVNELDNNRKEVYCFMRDFQTYRLNQNPALSFPVPAGELVAELERWKNDVLYTGPGSYSNANRTGVSQAGDQSNDWLYDYRTSWLPTDDGKSIQTMYIAGNLSTSRTEQDLDVIRPEYDEWKDAAKAVEKDNSGVTIMGVTERVGWIAVMDALVAGVVTGIPSSLAIALVVLIIATANWMVACLATLAILGVMASFFITFSLANWVLGMYECMFLQLTVGMAVDYIVHLAHAYNGNAQPEPHLCAQPHMPWAITKWGRPV